MTASRVVTLNAVNVGPNVQLNVVIQEVASEWQEGLALAGVYSIETLLTYIAKGEDKEKPSASLEARSRIEAGRLGGCARRRRFHHTRPVGRQPWIPSRFSGRFLSCSNSTDVSCLFLPTTPSFHTHGCQWFSRPGKLLPLHMSYSCYRGADFRCFYFFVTFTLERWL